MDHLPLPLHPIGPRPMVPLLCDSQECSSVSFLEYPLQVKPIPRPEFLQVTDWEIYQACREAKEEEADRRGLEAFLQAWLYFSLLSTFLTPAYQFEAQTYVETTADQQYVQTKSLCQQLDAWTKTVNGYGEDVNSALIARLQKYLNHATLVLNASNDIWSRDHESILLSIKVLMEILSETLRDVTPGSEKVRHFSRYSITLESKSRMIENGWCPFELGSLFNTTIYPSVVYYLENMSKPVPKTSHNTCSERHCHFATIPLGFQPRHVCDDQNCGMLGCSAENVARQLDRGTQPLLDITGSRIDDLKIDIVPADGGHAYVALSHV